MCIRDRINSAPSPPEDEKGEDTPIKIPKKRGRKPKNANIPKNDDEALYQPPVKLPTPNDKALSTSSKKGYLKDFGLEDKSEIPEHLRKLTKRQRTALRDEPDYKEDVVFLSLPDKKPRKKRAKEVTEEQQLRKIENENRRKLHMQRMVEEQKKQVVDKILNEAGRKQKQRKEKEENQEKIKAERRKKRLPEDEPIIRYHMSNRITQLYLPAGIEAKDLFRYGV
eukprot:TRINITY_DN3561_c0_g1_i1.p1 TRINITY_DN3561_c0_g1~~TRINITY_DN3561_c0_g1_i1.p1  ORF type:complete len:224 (+),score=77.33 TRINITY_DN3561_c0_g1_i1:65-736(+)